MTRVLVVEDDPQTAEEIRSALSDHGFAVESAGTGREGLLKAAAESYDAIVLDRMLPGGLDGLGVLATLRTAGVESPVLILSALGDVDERIRGLRAGGDDYLTKPFDPDELVARIEVLLRRRREAPAQSVTVLQVGALHVDLITRKVLRDGEEIALLPTEYRILEFMMRHAGQTITRTMLFEAVWGYHFDPGTNLVEVHMSRLRKKIDPPGVKPLIQT